MKCVFALIVVIACCNSAFGRYIPVFVGNPYKTPRQDLIGGWIQQSEWFPIEINVPDTISSAGQGISNVGQGIANVGQGISSGIMNIGSGVGSWFQRIPFINRIISQFRPRPFKYYIIMPINNDDQQQMGGGMQFNPFDNGVSGLIPTYP